MSFHKHGRSDTKTPGANVSTDFKQHTLGDYLNQKYRQDALDSVAAENKLTFDQWYIKNFIANRVHGMFRTDHLELDEACRLAWNAAQENV